MNKSKIHYTQIDKATEANPYDEWNRTLCGLIEDETVADIDVTDNIEFVSCKRCLRSFPKYLENIKIHFK